VRRLAALAEAVATVYRSELLKFNVSTGVRLRKTITIVGTSLFIALASMTALRRGIICAQNQ
jgi:hypothetical protein